MKHLISLDAPEARDPRVAGAKAARLAEARAARLPVAPGWVVPVSASEPAMRVGAAAANAGRLPAARLAIAAAEVGPGLIAELEEAVLALGGVVVVRSSTAEEADARWAGAFSSYLDARVVDLAAAVRGCWASMFSRDVAGRCEEVGRGCSDLRMAVLVQAKLPLVAGGTARVRPDDGATISIVHGSPAAMMAGRARGAVADVGVDGRILGREASDADARVLREVASLARRVRDRIGDDTIEWGTTGDDLVVLQARTGAADVGRIAPPARVPMPVGVERVAMLATRFPAPLGDELVLPWALGLRQVPRARTVGRTLERVDEIRELASRLTSAAWRRPRAEAAREAARTFARLRGGSAAERRDAVVRLDALEAVEPADAAMVLGLIAGIAEELVRRDLLRSPTLIWRLTSASIERTLNEGIRPTPTGGPDRWEPFVFEAVAAAGRRVRGTAVAPGIGAGRVRLVDRRSSPSGLAPREVLLAVFAAPQLAPLLWRCSAVVTQAGSPGAHLFEVAHSLGVPVVTDVPVRELAGRYRRAVAAVDGGSGTVCLLEEPAGTTAPNHRTGTGQRRPETVGAGGRR